MNNILLEVKSDVMELFHLIDLDKNGLISFEEYKNLVEWSKQIKIEEDENLQLKFNEADINSDKNLSLEEFMSLINKELIEPFLEEEFINKKKNEENVKKLNDIIWIKWLKSVISTYKGTFI
jgi:Ca2+-binding EF-hand superfamily protein